MIIRSQDKKSIAKLDSVLIKPIQQHVQRKEFKTIGYKLVTSDNLEIGKYSTEEKAIRVLDMICEHAEALHFSTIVPNEWRTIWGNVFDMPSDEEVEV